MEIATSPHRPAPTPWGRLLVVVLGPVTALALLPVGLGLERYVVSGDSMAGTIGRGSVVFERRTPVADLRVGDVITYRAPEPSGERSVVTHRIVTIGPDGIVTQGDAAPRPDPWTLRPQEPTLPRVVLTLPWVGYAYLFVDSGAWLLLVGSIATLLLLLAGRLGRRGARTVVNDAVPERVLVATAAGADGQHGR